MQARYFKPGYNSLGFRWGWGLLPRPDRSLRDGVLFGMYATETTAPPSGQFPERRRAESTLPFLNPAPLHYSVEVPSCEIPTGYTFTLSINTLLSPRVLRQVEQMHVMGGQGMSQWHTELMAEPGSALISPSVSLQPPNPYCPLMAGTGCNWVIHGLPLGPS